MKTQKLLKSLVLFTLFSGYLLQAQITISGKVNFKNKGVKDVSVTLKDTYDGATTDENGKNIGCITKFIVWNNID